jgi:hypothetical protein
VSPFRYSNYPLLSIWHVPPLVCVISKRLGWNVRGLSDPVWSAVALSSRPQRRRRPARSPAMVSIATAPGAGTTRKLSNVTSAGPKAGAPILAGLGVVKIPGRPTPEMASGPESIAVVVWKALSGSSVRLKRSPRSEEPSTVKTSRKSWSGLTCGKSRLAVRLSTEPSAFQRSMRKLLSRTGIPWGRSAAGGPRPRRFASGSRPNR